jgi:hypothetical protein
MTTNIDPIAEQIARAPYLSSFLRHVLAHGAPEPAALVMAVGLLGAARGSAGKPTPSKAWANAAYLELESAYRRIDALANEEGKR